MRGQIKIDKLSSFCKVIAGQSPKGSAYNENGIGVEFHQGKKAFGLHTIEPSNVWTTEITKLAQPGDILMSVRAPVGPTNFTDREVCIGRGLAAIRCKPDVLPQYILYVLKSIESKIVEKDGAVFNSISKDMIEDLPVPAVDKIEQQRIVDVLDQEFAKIDALKTNAEKSLQAAKDLFQATLKKELEPKEGWKVKTIGEVCEFQNGFAFKSSTFTDAGEPIIRISDIQNDEVIDTNVVYFNPSSYQEDLSRFIVYPGDILIAMSGGTTGKLGMNNTQKCFYLNQRVGVFRENKALLNHEFLFLFLHTKSEESLRISAGAAQPNLSTAQIKAFEIPVPSLQEQDKVVLRLNDLNDKCKVLQQNYQKTLSLCDDLKQSLLRKAFTGEL